MRRCRVGSSRSGPSVGQPSSRTSGHPNRPLRMSGRESALILELSRNHGRFGVDAPIKIGPVHSAMPLLWTAACARYIYSRRDVVEREMKRRSGPRLPLWENRAESL